MVVYGGWNAVELVITASASRALAGDREADAVITESMDRFGWLREQLAEADTDLLREMARSFAEALMGAEADPEKESVAHWMTDAPDTFTPDVEVREAAAWLLEMAIATCRSWPTGS